MTNKEKIKYSIKALSSNAVEIVNDSQNNYDAREDLYKEIERFLITLSPIIIDYYGKTIKNTKVNS
jgi:hypothetical protein|tara:strand:- start:997 stop:1194 length:198 start_codon:yes stop_codon:yes gene_type:complete